jgi:hypothetical protein
MKVNLFTAADYVDTSSGKLTIVGAFDNINAVKCPFSFKPFGVAAKVLPEAKDFGKIYDCTLILKKEKAKKPVLEIPLKIHSKQVSKEKINSVLLGVNLIGAKFNSYGIYNLQLKHGKKTIASTKLKVVREKAKEIQSKG